MKKKVKMCKNSQCNSPVNLPQAIVCAGCGADIARNACEFLSEEEIEKRLHPEPKSVAVEELAEEPVVREREENEYIICPACHRKMIYRIGLEFCDGEGCGEFVGDQLPILETIEDGTVAECSVTGMRSIDGRCQIVFHSDFMIIGREAEGMEYFQNYGKRKVSREHAVIKKTEGKWYISYRKKEERTYSDGLENPVYINGRKLERTETYCLMSGDEIAFAELNTSDPKAAFFRVE